MAEADIITACGHALAAIARKEAEDFREVRKEMTRLGARLYALRGQCVNLRVPIPPCLLDKAIDATAPDSTFPALYRHSRDGIVEFLDKLASDPQARFDLTTE